MKNILIIGGGLAALYFATQNGKKGGDSSTPGNNFSENGSGGNQNNGSPVPAVVSGSAVASPKTENKGFSAEIVAIDTSKTGFKTIEAKYTVNQKSYERFELTARVRITNNSGKAAKVKEVIVNSTMSGSEGKKISYKTDWAPGESDEKEFTFSIVPDKGASQDQILESMEIFVLLERSSDARSSEKFEAAFVPFNGNNFKAGYVFVNAPYTFEGKINIKNISGSVQTIKDMRVVYPSGSDDVLIDYYIKKPFAPGENRIVDVKFTFRLTRENATANNAVDLLNRSKLKIFL